MIEMTSVTAGEEVTSDEVISDVDNLSCGVHLPGGSESKEYFQGRESGFQPLDQQMLILRTVGI